MKIKTTRETKERLKENRRKKVLLPKFFYIPLDSFNNEN